MLHPGVRRQDEQRREHRPDRHQPDARQVNALGETVPAEHPQAQERRLQEERGQALHRQRGAEHVADVARVGRPVHPELELLHEPGHHADGDVDQQQRAEEFAQPPVLGVAVAIPGRLQDRDQEREPDRDRHEQEVVDARGRELPACEFVGHLQVAADYDPAGRGAGRRGRRRARQPDPDYLRTGGIRPPMIQKIGIGMPIRNMIQWPCLIDRMPRNRNKSTYSSANAADAESRDGQRRCEISHRLYLPRSADARPVRTISMRLGPLAGVAVAGRRVLILPKP